MPRGLRGMSRLPGAAGAPAGTAGIAGAARSCGGGARAARARPRGTVGGCFPLWDPAFCPCVPWRGRPAFARAPRVLFHRVHRVAGRVRRTLANAVPQHDARRRGAARARRGDPAARTGVLDRRQVRQASPARDDRREEKEKAWEGKAQGARGRVRRICLQQARHKGRQGAQEEVAIETGYRMARRAMTWTHPRPGAVRSPCLVLSLAAHNKRAVACAGVRHAHRDGWLPQAKLLLGLASVAAGALPARPKRKSSPAQPPVLP